MNEDAVQVSKEKKVVIYSTPSCHFCHMAKEFFAKYNIAYTNYDVSTDAAKRDEMMAKSGGMSVPVILVDDEMMVGFDEGKIKELLNVV